MPNISTFLLKNPFRKVGQVHYPTLPIGFCPVVTLPTLRTYYIWDSKLPISQIMPILRIALILIFGCHLSLAQHYPIVHYTPRDGLTQSQVTTLFKDSRGHLWIGTKNGFSKFNGENFTNYYPDYKYVNIQVNNFAEDSRGFVYMYSHAACLSRFDGKNFTRIRTGRKPLNTLFIDHQDRLFCIDDQHILHTVEADSVVEARWPSLKNKRIINHINFDKASRSIVAQLDSVGLVYVNPQRCELISPLFERRNKSHHEYHFAWHYTPLGQPVVETEHLGEITYYVQFADRQWKPFLRTKGKEYEVLQAVPFNWIFNFQSKSYLLEANTQRITEVFPHWYTSLVYTENGAWLGTEKGLVRVLFNGFRYFTESEVPYAWTVVEDAKKDIWIASYDHPLQRYDGQHLQPVKGYQEVMRRQLQVSNNLTDLAGERDSWYYHAIRDKKGHLWLPEGAGILWHDNKKFEFIVRPNPVTNHPNSIAICLLEDPTRNVVLQGSEKVVHIFENQPPFRHRSLTPKEGMNVEVFILSMALEKPGVYWIGGCNMLTRYDDNTQQWTEYSRANKKYWGGCVSSMTFDQRKTLWMATLRKGLMYFDARRDTLLTLPSGVAELEGKATLSSVAMLDNDHLLIGALQNLYIMDLKAWYERRQVVLKCYNHHNGFVGIEPSQDGFYKDSQGRVWIMSGSVLSVLDPKKLSLKPQLSQTYFTKLNQKPVPFVGFTRDSVFKLPFGTNTFRVDFESVGGDKPFRSQYSYWVEGQSKRWSDWQEEPFVTLANLPSGTYKMLAKSRTGSSEGSDSPVAVLQFVVEVWPWQSPYLPLYAALVLIGMGVLGGYFYWKNKQKRQQAELDREKIEVEKQQANLEKQKADQQIRAQEQTLQLLELKAAQAQLNPHFVSNTLTSLQEIVYKNEVVEATDSIGKFGVLIRSYMNASLSLDGTRESLKKGMITLEKEIELLQMYLDFELLQYRDRFEACIEVSDTTDPTYFKIPPLMIQPFVENAIKHGVLPNHTKKGKVTVKFVWIEADDTLLCTVEDDGVGMAAAEASKTTRLYGYQSESTTLLRKRAKLFTQLGYHVTINTTDRPDGGTIVTLMLKDNLD